jgi:hypothetical protein
MTKRNKLILGAVVVLGIYYLYDRNKKMKAVSDAKNGANVQPDITEVPVFVKTPTAVAGVVVSTKGVR